MRPTRTRARLALTLGCLTASAALLPEVASAQPLSVPEPPAVARQAAPHGFHQGAPPADISQPDPAVPPRLLLVEVVDGDERPVPGVRVELVSSFESIAEGKRFQKKEATTSAEGLAHFSELDTSLHFTHEVRVARDGATYVTPTFRATDKAGHRVRLHVYPVTSDIKEAFLGMRGFVLVEIRDGSFHFDVLYRVFNMSRSTFLPRGIELGLPKRFEALDVGSPGTSGFSAISRGVELTGTYPPGQRDVRFQFQVPMTQADMQAFELEVPPHLAELRVLAEAARGMALAVPGFEPAEPTRGPDGKKILITRRLMQPGQSELQKVRIELSGLPMPGPSRWVVSGLALAFAFGGLGLAYAARRRGTDELEQDRKAARQVLLEELVELERAFRTGVIGPKTHEQSRRQLLEAVARLEEPESPPPGEVAPAAS